MEPKTLYQKVTEAKDNEARLRKAQAPVIAHYEREIARYRLGARIGLAMIAVGVAMSIAAALMR